MFDGYPARFLHFFRRCYPLQTQQPVAAVIEEFRRYVLRSEHQPEEFFQYRRLFTGFLRIIGYRAFVVGIGVRSGMLFQQGVTKALHTCVRGDTLPFEIHLDKRAGIDHFYLLSDMLVRDRVVMLVPSRYTQQLALTVSSVSYCTSKLVSGSGLSAFFSLPRKCSSRL